MVFDTEGCYPAGVGASGCDTSSSRRDTVTVPSMRNMVRINDSAAQANGMAVLVGEYGLPHASLNGVYAGFEGGPEFLQDKIGIFNEFGQRGISRIYWAFDDSKDVTWGLYNPDQPADPWHPWTNELFE